MYLPYMETAFDEGVISMFNIFLDKFLTKSKFLSYA